MTMIIEIQSRDWDVENITNALRLPAEREYVAHLTVDSAHDASTLFEGDVKLRSLDGDQLTVEEWSQDDTAPYDVHLGAEHTFDVEDIRRIEFY